MSFLSDFFGGSNKDALRYMKSRNTEIDDYIRRMQEQSRSDMLNLFPGAMDNRNMAYQQALDVFGQTMPQQIGVQNQGLQGFSNAILGLPGANNFQFDVDTGYTQQQVPQFKSIADLLGGGSGPFDQGGIPARDNDMSDAHDPSRRGGNVYNPNIGPGFGVSPGLGGGNPGADINRGIEDMLNDGYGPTTGLPAWMVDNADLLGGAFGMATGLPGGRFLGRLFQNHFYNNGGSLYNPAENLTPPSNQLLNPNNNPYAGPLHDAINDAVPGVDNGAQMSPVDQEAAAAAARERARQEWMARHFDPWAFTSQRGFGQMKGGHK